MYKKYKGIWFYGNAGTGKSIASKFLYRKIKNSVLLDGDDIRKYKEEVLLRREEDLASFQPHLDELDKLRLQEAAEFGDILLVAVNDDSSVKKIKGFSRPIVDQIERSEILAHYDFIDRIIIFDEKTPLSIIKKIRPQFLFKGDDYKITQVVGAKEIERWGGKVVLIKCIKGKSTSKIIERIKNGT